MPTLSAMFRLMDGYSSQIARIVTGTDKATNKMLGASKAADKVNDSAAKAGKSFGSASGQTRMLGAEMDSMSQKATKANVGLKTLIGTALGLAAAKKGMDITDSYTNASARLKMVNDGSQTPEELQGKVFAAANRSRGSYTDMASAVSKMNLLAGDSFTSNDEAIGFTELLQKSLKVSGAGTSEQQSAFLQLTQAMAAGKLQGDEFRSVMENAPMVADAIAKYMGKTKGELKEMSSEGLITADIIKNAMFEAAGDIEDKFSTMPMTFSDVWGKIKNGGMQAFGGVFEKLNGMLNSDMGKAAIEGLIDGMYLAAAATDTLLDGVSAVADFISDTWPVIEPIVLGIAGAMLVYAAYTGITSTALGIASMYQWALNSAFLACPITWVVLGVIALVAAYYAGVAAVNHFTGATLSGTGLICGALWVVGAFFSNLGTTAWNMIQGLLYAFGALAYNIAAAFANSIFNVQSCFYNLLATALTVIGKIADQLSKLPFVEFDSSGISSAADAYAAKAKAANGKKSEYKDIEEVYDKVSGRKDKYGAFKDDWASEAFKSGNEFGKGLGDKASNLLSGFAPDGIGGGIDFSQFGSAGNPAAVKGTGKGGAVKVEDEEDIEWMRRLAERDFVARIATNTLAPNIKVEFTGPITKEADVDSVAAHLGSILRDQIATAPEGVYAT